MVPSDTGGSSTPFLMPPCSVAGRPEGAVPRPVQRTVRDGAHAPTGLRIPVSPPLTCGRKVLEGPEWATNRCSPSERGARQKKSKENLLPMATSGAPGESYYTYGPARAGRRAILLDLPGRSSGAAVPGHGGGRHRTRPLRQRPPAVTGGFFVSEHGRVGSGSGTGPLPRSVYFTVNGSRGRPSAGALIWISVPILGHTPQS